MVNPLKEWEAELLLSSVVGPYQRPRRRRVTRVYVCFLCRYVCSSYRVQNHRTRYGLSGEVVCSQGHEMQYDYGRQNQAVLPSSRDDHQGWEKASQEWGPKSAPRRRPRRHAKTRHERELDKRLAVRRAKIARTAAKR